jgi:hypothetical protein
VSNQATGRITSVSAFAQATIYAEQVIKSSDTERRMMFINLRDAWIQVAAALVMLESSLRGQPNERL